MRFNRRKMKFYRRKINNVLTLSILIMVFTVGYALITTTVNINGTGYINRAEWNVHFANIQTKTGSVTPSTAPTISNNTSVTFVATLANPGDFYEFNIDVENTELNSNLKTIVENRNKRNYAMIDKLNKMGIPITLDAYLRARSTW